MPLLVVQPGSPSAREIKLKAGANSLGRGPANDFKLDDPSISGSHCQIVVENGRAMIKDLGSTNGTYVNRAPVKEAVLQAGQTVHLGGVEMMFYADAPISVGTASPPVAPRAIPAAPSLPPPRAVAPAGVARIAGPPPPVAAPRIAAPPIVEAPPDAGTPSGPCKRHPKVAARQFCEHCRVLFCDACVTLRAGHRYCRQCGAECVPVRVALQRAAGPKGFFARFPGAFIYPFRGAGVMWLLLCAVVISFVEGLAGAWWYLPLMIAAYGYLFAFMQNIIHATANEEEEMPGLPGFDDVFGCAFRFGVVVIVCFCAPVVFFVLRMFEVYDAPPELQISMMVLGCLYFPMAFLAVAMKDTVMAANPLVVIPAILKVPLGYLLTTGVLIGVYLLRTAGNALAGHAQGVGYHTRSMSTMFLTFGMRAVWSLISVYLIIVSMRTMGLLYVANKEKFGWFNR